MKALALLGLRNRFWQFMTFPLILGMSAPVLAESPKEAITHYRQILEPLNSAVTSMQESLTQCSFDEETLKLLTAKSKAVKNNSQLPLRLASQLNDQSSDSMVAQSVDLLKKTVDQTLKLVDDLNSSLKAENTVKPTLAITHPDIFSGTHEQIQAKITPILRTRDESISQLEKAYLTAYHSQESFKMGDCTRPDSLQTGPEIPFVLPQQCRDRAQADIQPLGRSRSPAILDSLAKLAGTDKPNSVRQEDVKAFREFEAGIIRYSASGDDSQDDYIRWISFLETQNNMQEILGGCEDLREKTKSLDVVVKNHQKCEKLLQHSKFTYPQHISRFSICNKLCRTLIDGHEAAALLESGKKNAAKDLFIQKMGQNFNEFRNMANSIIRDPATVSQFSKLFSSFVDSLDYFKNSSKQDPTLNLFRTYLLNYYEKNSMLVKRDLLSSQLSLYPEPTPAEAVKTALNNSGPVMHKLLQFVSEKASNEEDRAQLRQFKSNIQSMPPSDLKVFKRENFSSDSKKLLKNFNEKPLAVASVGQVHTIDLQDGTSGVIKLQKPFLKNKSVSEFQVLNNIITELGGQQTLKEIVRSFEDSIEGEFDFAGEQSKLVQGQVYVDSNLGIDVVKPISGMTVKDAIAMQRAKGDPLSDTKFTHDPKTIGQRAALLSNLLKKWLDVALFGNGFMHGDLHAGNILFSSEIHKIKLSLIDFGNAITLPEDDRKAIIKLLSGVSLNNKTLVLNAFSAMSKLTIAQTDIVKVIIDEALANSELSVSQRVDQIINIASKRGVKLSGGVILFNRGRVLLQSQVENLVGQMGDSKQAPDIAKIYKDVFSAGVPKVKRLLGTDLIRML